MPWYARSSERGLKLTGANDILERAIASLSYAKEFSKAASIITEGRLVANMPLIAVTYLYGHAIELALKSILVKNDVIPEDNLKNIGHDLEKALKKANSCPEKAFLGRELQEIISMLNPKYERKHFEYHPGAGGIRFPDVTNMQKTVEKLIRQLDGKYRDCRRHEKRHKRSSAT